MKKLLFSLMLCLPVIFVACDNDDEPDFFVPELTDSNTIQFTFETGDSPYGYIEALIGEKVAVDWGDGTMNKYYASDGTHARHEYGSRGTFRIKVWSDELTLLNIMGLLHPLSNLSIGNCPKLEALIINSIGGNTSFKIGNNCPNLTDLNIGNWASLSSLDISECTNLRTLACYTNEGLKALDVSKNSKLETLRCSDNRLETLVLGNNTNLKNLECGKNRLRTIDIEGSPNISDLYISDNEIATIDLSKLQQLSTFYGDDNSFSTLDISNNQNLSQLSCRENKITDITLDAEKNKALRYVRIADNELEANTLDKIFTALPVSSIVKTSISEPQPNAIQYYGNPGEGNCKENIITDKGWKVIPKGEFN